MADLREKYQKPDWNADSFIAYCEDRGIDHRDGVVFTIKETTEEERFKPGSKAKQLCDLIHFHEVSKSLIISVSNSEGLFAAVGSETEDWPEKRIRLYTIPGNKENPWWIRVSPEKIPPATTPFTEPVRKSIAQRLEAVGGSPTDFVTWAQEVHHPDRHRFPSAFNSADPADWCIGMMDALTEYAADCKRVWEQTSAAAAERAAEEARNTTPAPTDEELPPKPSEPTSEPTGYSPIGDQPPLSDDDIPF